LHPWIPELGFGWAKSSYSLDFLHFPVMKYNRALMMAILHEKVPIANVPRGVDFAGLTPKVLRGFPTGARRRNS